MLSLLPLCHGLCGSQKYTAIPGLLRQPGVHGHLAPLAAGHALAHWLGNGVELVAEVLQHIGRTGGLQKRQLYQHQQPAVALDQGAHRTGVGFPLDQVALSVAGELAVLDLRRAQVNARHVGDLPAPVSPFAGRHALVVGPAQAGDQVTTQFAHELVIVQFKGRACRRRCLQACCAATLAYWPVVLLRCNSRLMVLAGRSSRSAMARML